MAGFSVPKKKFKSSVHRHRVRRLIVEAWRLNKHELYAVMPPGIRFHLFFVFTDNKLPEYAPVLNAVLDCIEKLKLIAAAHVPEIKPDSLELNS